MEGARTAPSKPPRWAAGDGAFIQLASWMVLTVSFRLTMVFSGSYCFSRC